MLDVNIQVLDPLPRAPMSHLYIYLPNMFPLRCSVAHIQGVKVKTARPRSLYPHPCHVQFSEVQVCALHTHLHRFSLYMKQGSLSALPLWNVDQCVLARPPQVETLAVDVS